MYCTPYAAVEATVVEATNKLHQRHLMLNLSTLLKQKYPWLLYYLKYVITG